MSTPSPTGVLLVQLGTPEAPTSGALRTYLAQFLSDQRVVDMHPLFWKPVLHGIILRTRPRRSAALYKKIWTERGSPLRFHSEDLVEGIASVLGTSHDVRLAMRIGQPSVESQLDALMEAGCRRVVVVPLFPQYSSATTASVVDAVAGWTEGRRDLPALDLVRSFPDQPRYIAALKRSVEAAGVKPTRDEPLVMSFHGLPQRFVDAGDPYPKECDATATALAEALSLEAGAWRVTYQSRFGREQWLMPYTDKTLEALPGQGITSVSVIAPSFVADCLETIDELGREGRMEFEAAGGKAYRLIPCINSSDAAIEALTEVVLAGQAGAPCTTGPGCGCVTSCERLLS